jgi:hypothetical protein
LHGCEGGCIRLPKVFLGGGRTLNVNEFQLPASRSATKGCQMKIRECCARGFFFSTEYIVSQKCAPGGGTSRESYRQFKNFKFEFHLALENMTAPCSAIILRNVLIDMLIDSRNGHKLWF